MLVLPLPPLIRFTGLIGVTVMPQGFGTAPEKLTLPALLFMEETFSVKLAEPGAVTVWPFGC
jgi:hypothetical protein